VREIAVVGTRVRRAHACWRGAFCTLPPEAAPSQSPVPGFQPAGRRVAGLFVIARVVSAVPRTVTPAQLGLARDNVHGRAVFAQGARRGG
jgi:hypothetical protein